MAFAPHARRGRAAVIATATLLLPIPAAAQQTNVPRPRSLPPAIGAGTRTAAGQPGPNYWQNSARYDLRLHVTPPSPTVHGEEDVVYFNNSPDTLDHLVIKLYDNIHKPGATRARNTTPDFLTSGVTIEAFEVNGQAAEFPSGPTVFTSPDVKLPHPLLPHDSVRLHFRWHYDLSTAPGREGIIDSTTYYLAYFYPQVAVYDDWQGWEDSDFNGRQEFYQEFADYDVAVTVPGGFVVWGTGELENPADVLQPAALERYRASHGTRDVVHIATKPQMLANQVVARGGELTWRFSAGDVPDVAYGLSDHYAWDGTSVVVDDAAGRRASVQTAYADTAPDYPHMAGWLRDALDYFSHEWPGVPYPYPKTTAFQGYADMEYPMMVNDAAEADTAISRFVAEHELVHTYFPFYMGIDQSRWAFMDEGWATALEYFINVENMGQAWADSLFREFRTELWIRDPQPAQDVPIITPTDILGASVTYARNAYGKAAAGYLALHDLLGDDAFRRALHAYMATWHGKHPSPWDFFNSFDASTAQDLDWFFRDWFFEPYWIDRDLEDARRTATGYSLSVRNVGGMPAPFDVVLTYADGTTKRLHVTPEVWRTGDVASVSVPSAQAATRIALDGGIWPDATPENDVERPVKRNGGSSR